MRRFYLKKAPTPINENQRLKALHEYEILDTHSEEYFDDIVKLASMICNVPISLVSLVDKDRQWFKANVGLAANETSRDISFCGHAINQDEIFLIEDATKDERFFDNPLVTKEPNVVFYAGCPIIDNNGYALGTLCVIDHKAKRLNKKQKEQLKLLAKQVSHLIMSRKELSNKYKNAQLLEKLSQNLPGFIYTYKLNPDGTSCFPYSSNFIYKIYEVNPEDVINDATKVFERLHPEDYPQIISSIQHSSDNMSTWTLDYRVVLPKQGTKWVRGNANPEKLNDGSILWHGYISDITELKEKENTLMANQKMITLGEMAASIAHEINNPLAIIKTSASQVKTSLERKNLDEDRLKKYLSKIEENTDRVAKIIRGLTFFVNKSESDLRPESLKDVILDTINISSDRFKVEQVELDYHFPKNIDELKINCRPTEISQVILNLLNNSYEAIQNMEEKWIKIEVLDLKDSVLISVIDSGNGIPEDVREKILNPFYTTKTAGKGAGLGLTISQRIIESHHGKFWIDGNCPKTKFSFALPKYVKEQKKVA